MRDRGSRAPKALLLPLLIGLLGFSAAALAVTEVHSDPIAPVILGVTGLLFVALLGRFSARKLGLPSVLGELTIGIIAGNLAYHYGFDLMLLLREGPHIFDTIQLFLHDATLGNEICEALVDARGRSIRVSWAGQAATNICRSPIPWMSSRATV